MKIRFETMQRFDLTPFIKFKKKDTSNQKWAKKKKIDVKEFC